VRPLSTRSVVLSLLLGTHPPELPARELVRVAALLDVGESALRVALSRMVARGDLVRTGGGYRLAPRLAERQARQDAALAPRQREWDGRWELAAVAGGPRRAADRAALRTSLADLRLAELRDGLWLRPANLVREWPDLPVQRFTADPEGDPTALARALWDLDARAAQGRELGDALARAVRPRERFAAAAAVVRFLRTDPVLPAALLPPGWPGESLHGAYAAYRGELAALPASGRPPAVAAG
jgi:phenylacetic acid degradation operon negative regulatory protein